jgi:phosphatidylglycerol:prolipoprotein diacylglycerol transferase
MHVLFEALAYALGFRLFLVLKRRQGDAIAPSRRLTVITAAAVGAALGSKLLYWADQPSITWAHRQDLAFLAGGKTLVGGLLGGLVAVEWVKSRIGETRATGDLFVLPLCLGIALGRVGCFLTGLPDHTYGVATTLPWGVDFGDGVPRHPTQLYEIAWMACIAAWAWARRYHTVRAGDLFRGFMILYLAFRLPIEFLKPERREYASLSGIQLACVLFLIYYARDAVRVFTGRKEAGGHGPAGAAVPVL